MRTALFHFLWQGAAIAGVLAWALCYVRSARVRYGLACAALLALPVTFGITVAIERPVQEAPIRFVVWPPPTLEAVDSGVGSAPRAPFDPVWAWLVGMCVVYAYRVFGWVSAQWLRRAGVVAAPVEWQQRLGSLRERLRVSRPVVLLESAIAKTPVTIGALRPVILFPVGLLAGMPAEQVEAILLHELAHIRRHDYLVNLAQSVIEGLLFYHPATWWISHVIRREREFCCDDLAAGASGAGVYAQALAALAERRVEVPLLAATGGSIMARMQRLLYPQRRVTSPIPAAVFLTVATAAGMFAFKPAPKPQARPRAVVRAQPAPAPAPRPVVRARARVAKQDRVAQAPLVAQATPQQEPVRAPRASYQEIEAQLRAQLETPYKKWLNEEVVWIITPEERTAFGRLGTDEEREMFIEQFWLRRDPTPDTAPNEYRDEHYRRIAWANDRFTAGIPGWKTDRGMVYIKFGWPDEREEHPATQRTRAFEKWRYRFLEGIGRDVIIEFVDRGDGDFRMTWDPKEKDTLFAAPTGLTLFQQMGLGGR